MSTAIWKTHSRKITDSARERKPRLQAAERRVTKRKLLAMQNSTGSGNGQYQDTEQVRHGPENRGKGSKFQL